MKVFDIEKLSYRMSAMSSVMDFAKLIGTTAEYNAKLEGVYFSTSMDMQKSVVVQRDDEAQPWTAEKFATFMYAMLVKIAPVTKKAVTAYGNIGAQMVALPEMTILVSTESKKYHRFLISDGQHRFRWLYSVLIEGIPFPKLSKSARASDSKAIDWYIKNLEGKYFNNPSKPSISKIHQDIIETFPVLRIEMGDGSVEDFIFRNGGLPISRQISTKLSISNEKFSKEFTNWLFDRSFTGRAWACKTKSKRDYALIDSLYMLNYLTGVRVFKKKDAMTKMAKIQFKKDILDIYAQFTEFLHENEVWDCFSSSNSKYICEKSIIAFMNVSITDILENDSENYKNKLKAILKKHKITDEETVKQYISAMPQDKENVWNNSEMYAEALTMIASMVLYNMIKIFKKVKSMKPLNPAITGEFAGWTTRVPCTTFVFTAKESDNGDSGAVKTTASMHEKLHGLGVIK